MAEVRLTDIRKSYGSLEVIKGVNLEVSSGEFVVFVGPSGCGKSTTGRAIMRLIEPDSGSVMVGGQDVCCVGICLGSHGQSPLTGQRDSHAVRSLTPNP